MLSAASKVTGGEVHGTREKPTVRASCKQGFDGSVHRPAPVRTPSFQRLGCEGRQTGALVQASTRETAQSAFLDQSDNQKQMAGSNQEKK